MTGSYLFNYESYYNGIMTDLGKISNESYTVVRVETIPLQMLDDYFD